MTSPVESWLQEGMAAARAGEVQRARELLVRVVEADRDNVRAWYWLSRVVESPREREICLENVQALDPGHTAVQAELAELRRQRDPASAASLLSREAIEAAIPRTPEEMLIAEAAVVPLECPYCGTPAEVEARQCPHCGRALYTRRPKSKGHSVYSLGLVAGWFGLANWVWMGVVVYYLLAGYASATDASPGAQSTFRTLGELLGFEGTEAPFLDLPLAPILVAGGLVFLFSLFVAWGLYRRLRFFYWLTVGLILLFPLVVIYQVASAGTVSLYALIVDAVLFLAVLGFAFTAYDEFAWVEERLEAGVDRDVDSPSALYSRGRAYADRGMWAKAAAHWSRAAALSPGHAEYRLALASAYLNLGKPQRAVEHVHEAQRIEPGNPRIGELLEEIEQAGRRGL